MSNILNSIQLYKRTSYKNNILFPDSIYTKINNLGLPELGLSLTNQLDKAISCGLIHTVKNNGIRTIDLKQYYGSIVNINLLAHYIHIKVLQGKLSNIELTFTNDDNKETISLKDYYPLVKTMASKNRSDEYVVDTFNNVQLLIGKNKNFITLIVTKKAGYV